MANKTIPLKLFRTHYQVAEVAKMLNCEEADVFYLAGENELSFSAYVGREGNFSKHRVRCINEFINHLDSLDKDDEGYSYISQYSLIKIHEIKNDKNLVILRIKGYFKYPPRIQKDFIYFSGQFPVYPSLLVPAGEVFSEEIKFFQIDWKNSDGLFFEHDGYIESDDVRKLYNIINNDVSSSEVYKSLSIAQQERHATKRNQVLSVAIYLYKENSNIKKDNATALTKLVFSRAAEFWPDKKEPPLSFEVICKMIASIFKKPIF
ncbi:hypothetical protein H2Z43_004700, partial [Salmonella enterica]|nr:hypothetical protein [Salmonella enterica]